MIDQQPSAAKLPPEMVASLLQAALRVQKKGDRVRAGALLRALASQQPDEPRVWAALATVAQTRDEQLQALERLASLDPQHPLARRAAQLLGKAAIPPAVAQPPATAVGVAPRPEAAPLGPPPALAPTEPEYADGPIRWPAFVVAGVMLLAVLAAVLLTRAPPAATDTQPTPGLPIAGGATPAPAGPAAIETAPAPATNEPAAAVPAAESRTSAASTTPRPSPRPTPQPTPEPVLAPGQVIEQGQWHVSLLRPEHALALDGSIGALQPRGRFVLALVTIGNSGATPARIPPDLVTLVDRQGIRYSPSPSASTAYLTLFGRAQRGDLSMEEAVPPGGGNVSVPLIFDVPRDAGGLAVHIGEEQAGWPVGEAARMGGPAATPAP